MVDELTYQLSDSKASIIIVHPSILTLALESASNVKIPTSKIFVFDDKDYPDYGVNKFTSLFKEEDDSVIINYTTEEKVKSTTAYLCYSSGTTGRQKGVEITHYNIVSNIDQFF